MYIYRIIKIYIKTEKIPLLIFNLKLLQDKCCHLIIFNFRLKQIRIPTKNKQYSGTYDYKKKRNCNWNKYKLKCILRNSSKEYVRLVNKWYFVLIEQ